MIDVDLGRAALLSLLAISALSTLAGLAVLRRFTNRDAFQRATNVMIAHLLECTLFLNEPRLVFRAQGELIRDNLRLLRLVALPIAILFLPFWFLFAQLQANFGQAPLSVGTPAVLTFHDGSESRPELKTPPEIAIETPAVRDVFDHEVNWRIRPLKTTSGPARIALPDRFLTTSVRAGHRVVATIVNPFVKPQIDLHYPAATLLHHHWLTWYIAASALTALVWWARYH